MSIANLSLALSTPASSQLRDAAQTTIDKDTALRETAKEFESVFIAEMLSHAGLDKALSSESGFGGEAFSQMLVETYAQELSEKGGFGLADKIYRQLKDHTS